MGVLRQEVLNSHHLMEVTHIRADEYKTKANDMGYITLHQVNSCTCHHIYSSVWKYLLPSVSHCLKNIWIGFARSSNLKLNLPSSGQPDVPMKFRRQPVAQGRASALHAEGPNHQLKGSCGWWYKISLYETLESSCQNNDFDRHMVWTI